MQMLSYPFALRSASSCKTGEADRDSNSEKMAEAFEISERLRKVDIVAQGSHGEPSSFDMSVCPLVEGNRVLD
jgi:hypothetical protein